MSAPAPSDATVTEERSVVFYRRVMTTLREGGVPFMVGGAYALARYTGIGRVTKDFDVFLRRQDMDAAPRLEQATTLTPHRETAARTAVITRQPRRRTARRRAA